MPDSNLIKLRKKTYLKMIENSVGARLFNSLFVKFKDTGKVVDIYQNGTYSCAFFVSSVLTLLKYIDSPHSTVNTVKKELVKNNWQEISGENLQPGDVVIWEEVTFEDGTKNQHIGFVLNRKEAVSTNFQTRKVERHHITFGVNKDGTPKRKITTAFRPPSED